MWNVPGWKASAVFFSVNQNGEPGPPRAQQVSPPPPVRPMPCGPDHRARPPWRSDAARRCRCKRSPQGRQHSRGRPPPHPYPPQRALGVGTGAGCRSGGGGGGGGDVRLLPSSLPCDPRGLHTRERAGESRARRALTSPSVAVTRARGRRSAESFIAQRRLGGVGGGGGWWRRRGHTEHNGPAGWGGRAEHHHHPTRAKGIGGREPVGERHAKAWSQWGNRKELRHHVYAPHRPVFVSKNAESNGTKRMYNKPQKFRCASTHSPVCAQAP